MQRSRAAVVLLLVLAAWAPPGQAGSAAAPELSDPADDQARSGGLSGQPVPPVLPGVNDDRFEDVDVTAAWFSQPRGDIILTVATTQGWTTGTLTATFRIEKGPTSYANSTASGQEVTVIVTGTAVTGVDNATASVSTEGLEVRMPASRLGAVGGDLLAGLNLTTSRTSTAGTPDPVTQDDVTGADTAGPGTAYMVARPAPASLVDFDVLRVANQTGGSLTLPERTTVPVALSLLNRGTDDDTYTIAARSDPPLKSAPQLPPPGALPRNAPATLQANIDLAGMEPGTIRVTFTATTGLGGSDDAVVTLVLEAPPIAARAVKPAGLDFLTPAAESTGLDDAFGSYAELALLALLVLAAITVVFLLVALAPSTLAGASAPESPPLSVGADAPPAGVLAPAAAAAPPKPANPPVASGSGTAGGALAIESVTHEPEAPEEGQPVATEVVLRNPGPTRQVKVVLALDGADADDKTVMLPARATKTVRLGWTAGAGENRVKVRVLPA